MSKVEDWIDDFCETHFKRCCRSDLPRPDAEEGVEYWKNWYRALNRIGATFPIADEASSVVAAMNLFPNQQLEHVIAECKRLFKEIRLTESAGYTPGTREAAVATTPEDCECGRGGIVIRYRHEAVGKGTGHNSLGAAVNCYCVCALGRWTRDHHEVDTRRCFLDLADRSDLQLREVPWSDRPDNALRHPPRSWDFGNGRPIAQEAHYAADKEAMEKGQAWKREPLKREARPLAEYMPPTPEDFARAREAKARFMPRPSPVETPDVAEEF